MKIKFTLLPIFLNRKIVLGTFPGNRIDVNTLKAGDTCYMCFQHKNLKDKSFYVEVGTIEKWNPITQRYTVAFDALHKKGRKHFRYLQEAYSNELGDTPEMAVHNMYSIYMRVGN